MAGRHQWLRQPKGCFMKTNNNEVIELNVEELEAVIAPGFVVNHNETLVSDAVR